MQVAISSGEMHALGVHSLNVKEAQIITNHTLASTAMLGI
jgi:hypothetical protein